MFCPSCGKQVEENNNFCPYCAKPLTARNPSMQPAIQPTTPPSRSQQYPTPTIGKSSHTGRNIAIGIVVGVLLIIIVVAALSSLISLNSGGGGIANILPTTQTVNIVNGLVTVNANSYEYYTFTIPSGASNIQVSGSFTASGGSGNDIKVFVTDQTDFVNWENGHSSQAYYQSGQETTGTISVTLPTSGTYVLVYDNTFSIISQKNVNTEADVSYVS
jgi:hypothetical protein